MNKTIFRFKFFDMPVSVARSAQIGTLILLILGTALAIFTTNLTPLDAFIAGILMTIIHWVSDLFHQYGHFVAAKQTGYRSTGTRLWWILGATRYPRNEKKLSHAIHVRRAIGGPIASLIILILFMGLGTALWNYTALSRLLVAWGIFINAVIFVGGALIPLKIGGLTTDGMILWRAWRQS
ncbi:MAG: hypothetical protein AAFV93_23650 [Chloroflexota bacterium]